jgi:DNA-directed RNA polymerase specialized sigma24 family protein
MTLLTYPWGAYARLQAELSTIADSHRSWGAEAGLDYFVAAIDAGQPVNPDQIQRATQTGLRRERYRAALVLQKHSGSLRRDRLTGKLTPGEPSVDPQPDLEVRSAIQSAHHQLPPAGRALLESLVAGDEYAEIASELGVTEAALRVRLSRLRRQIAA